jgi:hypothetical protein
VLFLMRTLRVRACQVPVAVLAFMFTPYTLDFASRISVILLPFAGLPWMLAVTIRALRDDRGWMYPAVFAVIIQIVGGVNATALIFAGVAPLLWIVFAVWVERDVSIRRAAAVVVKIGVLALATSAWWIAGLSLQSGYGLNVLKYTETLEVVSQASLPAEVMRGLGYWFYGRDNSVWTESTSSARAFVGIAINRDPGLAMCAAVVIRWRPARTSCSSPRRVVIAVGASYGNPSTLGGLQVVRRLVDVRPRWSGAGACSRSRSGPARGRDAAADAWWRATRKRCRAGRSGDGACSRTCRPSGRERSSARTSSATRTSPSTGSRRSRPWTRGRTPRGCWSSPAPISRRIAGATPSTPSRPV